MISSKSTTPHPLDSLLEIWDRVSEGQRQAIARDFHIRTGGMMDTSIHPTPRVVPLLAMETKSGEVGLLVGPGNKLPFLSLGMDLSPAQTASQFFTAIMATGQQASGPASLPKVEFSTFAEPVVSETGLYLFQSSSNMIRPDEYIDFLPGTWSVAKLSDVVCAQYLQDSINTWVSLAPLRYLGSMIR